MLLFISRFKKSQEVLTSPREHDVYRDENNVTISLSILVT